MPRTLFRNKSGWKFPRKEGSEVRGVSGQPCATKCGACACASAQRQAGRPCRPLLPPCPPGRPSPSCRRAPGNGAAARLLADLRLRPPDLFGLWKSFCNLVFKFFGGWDSHASSGGLGAAILSSICPHRRPAPPSRLVPRCFIFISVKTASAFGCSLEVTKNSCPGFMSPFWDRRCCQTNSESKSWALRFLSGVTSVDGTCAEGITITPSWYYCEDSWDRVCRVSSTCFRNQHSQGSRTLSETFPGDPKRGKLGPQKHQEVLSSEDPVVLPTGDQ